MITGLVLDCYNVSLLNFLIPHSWQVSSLIQFILNNPDLPLVDHLSLYLSACPIRHPFQSLLCVKEANVALFRGFSTLMQPKSQLQSLQCDGSSFLPRYFRTPLCTLFFCNIYLCLQNFQEYSFRWQTACSDLDFVYPR